MISINAVRELINAKIAFVLILLSIVLTSFLSYDETLWYYLIGIDTIPWIVSSRIQSSSDVVRIFTQNFLGSYIIDIVKHYRPLASLFFGLNYMIWNLNPLGYHLAALILHITNSILVFILAMLLTKKRKALGWFAAILFAIHPIHVNTVPDIPAMPEMLASLFLILSLILFVRYSQSKKLRYFIISILLCMMAIWSKETAVVIPILILIYVILFAEEKNLTVNLFQSIKLSLPYFALSGVYIVLRIIILGGFGGYQQEPKEILYTFGSMIYIAFRYLTGLLYPVNFLNIHFKSIFLSIYYFLQLHALEIIVVNGLGLLVLVCALIHFIRNDKNKMSLLNEKFCSLTENVKIYIFLVTWLIVFLGIYVIIRSFSAWYLYMPTAAFTILISMVLRDGLKVIGSAGKQWSGRLLIFTLIIVGVSGMAMSFFIFSPLVNNYSEWKDSSDISSSVLEETIEEVSTLPNNSIIYLINYPNSITYSSRIPYTTASILNDYSAQAMIDLKFPNKTVKVVGLLYLKYTTSPQELNSHTEIAENYTVITKIFHGGNLVFPLQYYLAPHRYQNRVIGELFEIEKIERQNYEEFRIHLEQKALNRPNSYFFIYNGTGIEVLSIQKSS